MGFCHYGAHCKLACSLDLHFEVSIVDLVVVFTSFEWGFVGGFVNVPD
jgi:hypothetical protein